MFKGPSSLNTIGSVSQISTDSYDASLFKESEFHWLSLSNGYFKEESSYGLSKIIEKIGFPVISTLHPITKALKNSRHMGSIRFFSPAIIRTYLKHNSNRWQDGSLSRSEVLQLFEYILKDPNLDERELGVSK